MVKEKYNQEEEQTVEEKLIALRTLQETLSEIDKIKTLRGELPLEVKDLEDDIVGLETRLLNYTASSKTLTQSIAAEKIKITEANEQLTKYKSQMEIVRNNREYDNLTREVEYQELEIQLAEKRIKEFNAELQTRKADIALIKEQLEQRKKDFEEKKADLDVIVAETRAEEEKLREHSQILEQKIEARLLTAFKRIRKGTFNGLAVVPIERDACGGCFNKIPPQKQLDVKLHKKIIVCEYCGRIMIDPEMGIPVE